MTIMRANLTAAAAVMLFASGAGAATTGSFIEVVRGNDPFDDGAYQGSVALYKCDEIPETGSPGCTDVNGAVSGENYSDGDFTIDFTGVNDDDDPISGEWSFLANGGETLVPTVIALKAGPSVAYYDIAGLASGMWSTADDLDSKAISHISFYDGELPPIPLPAGVWLLGGALGAIGLARRRRG